MTGANTILPTLLGSLPALRGFHAPGSKPYELLRMVARREIEALFSSQTEEPRSFAPFGDLVLPYKKMGAIDSLDLFGIDELILFSFYWANRQTYRRAVDLGANIGLHSVMLSRCGFEVRSYEPDPHHFEVLGRTLANNGCKTVTAINAAVSDKAGEAEFVRVVGNTTGSHLAGSKPNPYGELQRFPVRIEPFEAVIEWADFVKMDVEGHERVVLTASTAKQWETTDCMVEVGNPENAAAIFEHFRKIGVNLYAQRSNWHAVKGLDDMPRSYHDGSLFISCRAEVPWAN